jgi:Na+/H+-dicarboxylate symporter
MIIVALLITYAFCSAGEYFDTLRKGVDICYTLFSKMLHVVMFALPFFSFLAILTPLLAGSSRDLFVILITSALIVVSLGVIAAFYLIRLVLGGVKVGPFLKTLIPLVRENIKINSVIDAVPYNTRYCVRNYGYDRKRLSQQLPILAQTNLDGNCYLLMLLHLFSIVFCPRPGPL